MDEFLLVGGAAAAKGVSSSMGADLPFAMYEKGSGMDALTLGSVKF